MKKAFLFLISPFLIISFLSAQTEELFIKKAGDNFYVDHKVTPKENFYSVGRLFYIHPKLLASFNKLEMEKGLNLGQMIKIPLSDSNFSQENNEGTPVYYKVSEKESLLHISSINNKVPVEYLRKWNHLSGESVSSGTKLIVGFIAPKKASSVAIIKKEEPVLTPKKSEEKIISTDAATTRMDKNTVDNNAASHKSENKSVIKEEPKKEESKIMTEKIAEPGYFKTYFDQQVKSFPLSKEQTVTSGIFRTNSGWQEAKYYALIDGVEPGTIIKVTNPSNNRLIYAKVLGEMKGIKQNEGLDLRISNAAASALEIPESDKFIVQVNY